MAGPTMFQWLFIGEYLKDFKQTEALRRAGYSGNYARQKAWEMMRVPCVRDEIDRCREQFKKDLVISAKTVLEDAVAVLRADPREIVDLRHAACRYCHGVGHRYHFTPAELWRAEQDHWSTGTTNPFDELGGPGYDKRADPHPECPECGGAGIPYVDVKDTRELGYEAAQLFAGVEHTKHGIKVTMRSKDAARDALARFLGMNKETIKLDFKKPEDLSDDELAAIALGAVDDQ